MPEAMAMEVVVGKKPSYTEWTCQGFCTAIDWGSVR
jgi:hypothetical protein